MGVGGTPFVRIRQICLNAADLDWATNTLQALLDTTVAFRDPHILNINLFNALLYCGDCMLEVVSPTDEGWEAAPRGLGGRGPNTQAKQLMKQGDSGYMAIFQVEDQEGVSQRLLRQGTRPVGTPTMMFNEACSGTRRIVGRCSRPTRLNQTILVKTDAGALLATAGSMVWRANLPCVRNLQG